MCGCCRLLHPAATPSAPIAVPNPGEQVIHFLGAACHWTCLQWCVRQISDARGRMTGWACAIPQCVAGHGDGRENEHIGEAHSHTP